MRLVEKGGGAANEGAVATGMSVSGTLLIRLMSRLVLVMLPALAMALLLESGARLEFRGRHGYTYYGSLAYLPDSQLIYKNNPQHFSWRHEPSRRYDFFFIQPPKRDARPTVWVFGGSTSAARPDGMDWPRQFEADGAGQFQVVNMGHDGYGIGHVRWLYEHYAAKVNPSAIIIFSGWNYRGIMDSRFAYRPLNACSAFDGIAQCVSASLVNYSAAYGRSLHLFEKLREGRCAPPSDYPQLMEWKRDFASTVSRMVADHPVFLVEFPGLAIRDAVLAELRRVISDPATSWERRKSFACVADGFEAHRRTYDARIAVVREVASRTGAAILDARQVYLAMPAGRLASYFVDPLHQTASGNAVLGRALFREFIRQWDTSRESPVARD